MSSKEKENQLKLKESLAGGIEKSDNTISSQNRLIGSKPDEGVCGESDPKKLNISVHTEGSDHSSSKSNSSSLITNNSNVDNTEIVVVVKETKSIKSSLNMINNYGKQFLCILALILTVCATFQNM